MESSGKMTTVFLTVVRHGQSEGNVKHILQGSTKESDFPLTQNGVDQAQKAGIALKNVSFDRVYASDLERAFNTASIIIENNVQASNMGKETRPTTVQVNKLLTERTFGVFGLQTTEDYRDAARKAEFGEGETLFNYVPEGGEAKSDVMERVVEFFNHLTRIVVQSVLDDNRHVNRNHDILLVTHGGWIAQMFIYFLEKYNCELMTEANIQKHPGNASISTFELLIDISTEKLVSVRCTKLACSQHLGDLKNLVRS